MKRYQPPNPKDALPDELQALWDAIRRMREATARSILPYGYEFDITDDGEIRIVSNGAVVSISGTTIDSDTFLTVNDIDTICEECGGGDTTVIVEGGTGSGSAPQRTVTVSGPILDTDKFLLAQQGGPISLALPATATVANQFLVKDELGTADTNPITITAPGASTIDGSPSYTLDVPYMAVWIGVTAAGNFFIH